MSRAETGNNMSADRDVGTGPIGSSKSMTRIGQIGKRKFWWP